jgi:hypothetical protein
MIYNFVNLVSWRFFIEIKSTNQRTIFVDSLSLLFCCRLFGVKVEKKSGINFFHNNINTDDSIFLIASNNNSFNHKMILPFWKSIDEISISEINTQKLYDYNNIVIGISSPKQDHLAQLINNQFPEKNIFCLGAAIYTSSQSLQSDKISLNWLFMMFRDFKRFKNKMYSTLKELYLINFTSKSKEKFKLFLKLLN